MNRRMKNVQYSGIRKFFNEVKNYPDAISLTVGQPDFKLPKSIEDGVLKAISEGKTYYTMNQGIPELRERICKYLDDEYSIKFNKDEMILTVGGSEALFVTFNTIFNEGDNVLTPSPGYPAYENTLRFVGANPIFYDVNKNGKIDFGGIEDAFESKDIKGIVMCFPNNPTGISLTENDKIKFYEILRKYPECKIISDEMYSTIVYDKFETICEYEELLDRTILVSGFSKMFSMTGLRLGFICAKSPYIDELNKVHLYATSSAASIVQYGTLYGFDKALYDVEIMREEFRARRDFVYNRLIKMGFKVEKPMGAFYIFPSLEGIASKDSYDFCVDLIKYAGVACVPGSAFGEMGEGYMRISYCNSIDELEKGLVRIENYIDK
ncbi:pyridoxal phosphate-dependent aminotransferase [Candidatus Arthromitus sp. SFB-rat-Yit]|uniref:pyridoxal phosphate-dependent aminotransferase n=1 Tax=Candidatus Arthromitus sp. SFB-rat-Yit TaxID=1041504 RepID=UPI000227A31A|nr:aminotransferase class I/II-fold pyridoxal phosphate-dependent enzyme [Candidatus Arthromitus sp. SFB-rat-Yit]BAK81460.1 aminotransferase class I and II [Candidatus Arthromitus sp. SFB-rat-Yit]